MTSDVGRRVFVGSVVGALPMLGIAAAQSAHSTHTSGGSHPMEQEIEAQMRAAIAEMQGARPGEGARRLAATLRLGAAHYQADNGDESFKSALRAAIAVEGRDGVLARANDRDRLLAEVRQYGLTTLPDAAADVIAHDAALNAMLRDGFTPVMLRVAEQLERLSPTMDRGPVAVAAQRCPDTTPYFAIMEALMIGSCIWNPLMCAITSGMYVGAMLAVTFSYWYGGCYR